MLNKTFSPFPTLITSRLTLRQPLESDSRQILWLRSDPLVNKYLDRQPSETSGEVLSFIRQVNDNFKDNDGFYWGIAETRNDKLIGTICLFDFSDKLKKCEIGFELLPNYQGKGIMTEALQKIIEFASAFCRYKAHHDL